MITWSSKTAAAVLGLLTLTACDAVPELPMLGDLAKPKNASAVPIALSQTKMANGAFTLVPPEGFCIDKNSLKQRFAVLARCDALGAADAAGGAPLGIITVSATPQGTAETLPTPQQTADALKLARVTSVTSEADTVTFRAEGPPPIGDLDVGHWRGTIRIGGQLVSLALFGPEGGRAVSTEGRKILNSLIRRSRAGSTPSG